jgi:hypothetical protein
VSFGALVLLLSAGSLTLGAGDPQQSATPSAILPQQAVLNRYCLNCHNDKLKTAGLSLAAVDVANL